MQAIQKRAGQTFEVTVERGGRSETFPVTANVVKEKGPTGQEIEVGRIGVSIVTRTVTYAPYSPPAAVWQGAVKTWDMTGLTAKGFWKIVTGPMPRSNLRGPVPAASETGGHPQDGAAPLAVVAAGRSVNLAV